MRSLLDEETAALRTALDTYNGVNKAETAKLHEIERTREKLLADDAALTELIRQHPNADPQQLRTLVRNARKEALQSKPPRLPRAVPVDQDAEARPRRATQTPTPTTRRKTTMTTATPIRQASHPPASRRDRDRPRLDQRPRVDRRLRGQGPAGAAGLAGRGAAHSVAVCERA